MTELPQIIKGPHKEKPYRLVVHGWSIDLTEAELDAIVRQTRDIKYPKWHREYLQSADRDWYMLCNFCKSRMWSGQEAWVKNDKDGNGTLAQHIEHGDPNYFD